ncbi:MAG: acyltransferase [Planctomycetia bacterium]|nr:acyltransferase [Planctomycetia bacterium]
MEYSRPLDAVRAIAIFGVLVFHLDPAWLAGGFLGVDVFFVLSGYLITSVILGDIRQREFSLREFYLRRIQRIIPNAVLMIATTVVLYAVLFPPSTAAPVARHAIWSLLSLSNVFILNNTGGYWEQSATSLPLLHTWSLAVEEQFYLLFPPLVVLLVRRRILWPALIGLSLASLAACVCGSFAYPEATFYLLPTRAWQPLAGAALAVGLAPAVGSVPRRPAQSRSAATLGWTGLALIAFSFAGVTESLREPGISGLLPSLGTLLVLVAIREQAGPTRILSNPVLVLIGKLSYSLYLWHWPAIVIGRTLLAQHPGSFRLIAVGCTLAAIIAAIATYYVVEQTLRRRGPGRALRFAVIAAGFLIGLGTCIWGTAFWSGARTEFVRASLFDQVTFHGFPYESRIQNYCKQMHTHPIAGYRDVVAPIPPELAPDQSTGQTTEPWARGGIIKQWGDGDPRVVVFGCSHAQMYSPMIDDVCRQLGVPVSFLCANGTSIFFDGSYSAEFDESRRAWLKKWRPDVVFLIHRWDGAGTSVDELQGKVSKLIEDIEPDAGAIVVLTQVPVSSLGDSINPREYVQQEEHATGALPKLVPDGKEPFRRSMIPMFQAIAAKHPKVRLIRADEMFYAADGSIRYASGRSFFYTDDDHLSDSGAALLQKACYHAVSGACRR